MPSLFRPSHLAAAAATVLGLLTAASVQAGTVIYNTGNAATATVALGVNDLGHLNTTPNVTSNAGATGVAFRFGDGTLRDGTAPGCLCEGWGVSAFDGTTTHRGTANVAGGTYGLTASAPSAVTTSTVTTTATVTSLPTLTVTQAYAPAAKTSSLFVDNVTITNSGPQALTDLRYARAMDWDIPPTEFNEYVTIKGTATTTALEFSNDNGFCTTDPTIVCDPQLSGTNNVDFTDSGPADHGAYFRFNFGTLAAGESRTFSIYYGAAGSETAALAAIGAEGIELYSLGQSNGGQTTGSPATYIFGFKGVGGVAVEPNPDTTPLPEPGSMMLASLGLAGAALARRRRRA